MTTSLFERAGGVEPSDMAQNIYDDPGFFAGYGGLARSIDGLDGAPEWPDIRAMLPDLTARRVVDLGCGFGWFARWARAHGAASVHGIDLSHNMIGRARADTADAGIAYEIADLETIVLPRAAYDFAYSSLALHYIADLGRLLATLHGALAAGGQFVFTTEHPIFMAPSRPGWVIDGAGRRTWPIDRYSDEGPRITDWLAPGVVKQHRTLGTTLNALVKAGFAIGHVEEWRPTPRQIAAAPALAEEVDRPMLLLVRAQRA